MKLKFCVYFLIKLVFFIFCCQSFAETIYLRDGRVLNEKIVERGSYYIVTMTDNVPRRYFNDQIERIEEDKAEVQNDTTNIKNIPTEYISEDKAQLISDFIDVSGVRTTMKRNIESVIAQASKEKRGELRDIFTIDEIIERLIPVYHKYYSEEDLKAIIQFYQSPAGEKVLEVTPKIMEEVVGVSVQYIKEKMAP